MDIPLPLRKPAAPGQGTAQAKILEPLPDPDPEPRPVIPPARIRKKSSRKMVMPVKASPSKSQTGLNETTAPDETRAPARVQAGWTRAEVSQARTACRQILKTIRAATIRMPPIREGACGTPAPVRLTSIAAGRKVRIIPPATLNCRMLVALDRWLARAQGSARKWLGADIAALHNVSSYSCRNRYNGANRKISQHAFANALDIAAFTLSDGRRITVKAAWGPTRRDLEKQAPAANSGKTAPSSAKQHLSAFPKTTPGRKQAVVKMEKEAERASERAFVRTLHRQACRYFGTVLGPEANDAHRDHFHLDLAPRKRSHYCE